MNPYVFLKKGETYYCPGHNVNYLVNKTDRLLRVSNVEVKLLL